MNKVDLIIKNIMAITLDSNRRILKDGAVAIADNCFVAVKQTDTISKEFESDKVIDGKGKTLFPGFINLHGHLFQNGIRER